MPLLVTLTTDFLQTDIKTGNSGIQEATLTSAVHSFPTELSSTIDVAVDTGISHSNSKLDKFGITQDSVGGDSSSGSNAQINADIGSLSSVSTNVIVGSLFGALTAFALTATAVVMYQRMSLVSSMMTNFAESIVVMDHAILNPLYESQTQVIENP
ncbi:hypothetical protein HK100_010470, partial [Physocladia obscura]